MQDQLEFLGTLRGLCKLARGKGSVEVARLAIQEEERLNRMIAERLPVADEGQVAAREQAGELVAG